MLGGLAPSTVQYAGHASHRTSQRRAERAAATAHQANDGVLPGAGEPVDAPAPGRTGNEGAPAMSVVPEASADGNARIFGMGRR